MSKYSRGLAIFAPLAAFLCFLAYNDIPSDISEADKAIAGQLLGGEWGNFNRPATYDEEIALVLAAQDAVLRIAPIDEGLPLGQPRELSQLMQAGRGLCYDRSRAIETILRLHGMKTRHAAVYSTAETDFWLRSLLTPGTASHAVSEVETQKGWLVVDSNARWISLTPQNMPLAMSELRERHTGAWSHLARKPINRIFTAPFTWVYGLYSRHGKFYPPYLPIPDIEWSEMIDNFFPKGS